MINKDEDKSEISGRKKEKNGYGKRFMLLYLPQRGTF